MLPVTLLLMQMQICLHPQKERSIKLMLEQR